MSFCAVHMMKMQSSALGGVESHNQREHESRKNKDIDYEKSKYNYDTVNPKPINYQRAVKGRVADLHLPKAVRKDAVVLCSFIVSSDQGFFSRLGFANYQKQNPSSDYLEFVNLPQEIQDEHIRKGSEEFFKKSTEFFQERYGKENVICGAVHLDEATPHMHLGLVPVTKDGRLSAKAIFTPLELKNLQTDFARSVGAEYDLERGIEGSDATHLNEIAFKIEKGLEMSESIEARVETLEEREVELTRSVETLEKRAESLNKTVEGLQTDISALEAQRTLLERMRESIARWFEDAKKKLEKVLADKQSMAVLKGQKALEFIEKKGLLNEFNEYAKPPVRTVENGQKASGMSISEWKEQIAQMRSQTNTFGSEQKPKRSRDDNER